MKSGGRVFITQPDPQSQVFVLFCLPILQSKHIAAEDLSEKAFSPDGFHQAFANRLIELDIQLTSPCAFVCVLFLFASNLRAMASNIACVAG